MVETYDKIGVTYQRTRTADSRIGTLINRCIGSSNRILNIGAGTGSYEPSGKFVVAVEPSVVMLNQRAPNAAPAVQAVAESLPFISNSFDLSLAILTIHHWSDWRRGFSEALRVSGGRFITLTWVGFPLGFWLLHYLPEIEELDLPKFPTIADFEKELGSIAVDVVPVPHDCEDGFLCAYWRRPAMYLDPLVRNGISTLSKIPNIHAGLKKLERELASGKWEEKFGDIVAEDNYDYGYRLISCGVRAA